MHYFNHETIKICAEAVCEDAYGFLERFTGSILFRTLNLHTWYDLKEDELWPQYSNYKIITTI